LEKEKRIIPPCLFQYKNKRNIRLSIDGDMTDYIQIIALLGTETTYAILCNHDL
jgi:hypothetical protein